MIVMTAGISGTCYYRQFESVGDPPPHASREPFRVREMRKGILEVGRVAWLTRTRDWMHTFRAGAEGASIVDFGCSLSEKSEFSYVAISDKPVEKPTRTYEAVWEGRD